MKKHFPRPRKRALDQLAIAAFLPTIGFQVDTITQEWRHLTAIGKFAGKLAVFKLASTLKVSRYTQNEWAWNEAVTAVPLESRPHLRVPRNFTSGLYGRLFYLVTEFYQAQPLARGHEVLHPEIKRLIPLIAQVTHEIETLPIALHTKFAQRHAKKTSYHPGERLLSSATEWASQVPLDLSQYLKVIETAKNYIQTCPAHGDFVLRQMFLLEGALGLIDGEHAGYRAPRHYDTAQLYIRLRHDFGAHELAAQYLRAFHALLSPPEQAIFWEELKPVLLQRYIGDLWGSAKNPTKLTEMELVGREIVSDQVAPRLL